MLNFNIITLQFQLLVEIRMRKELTKFELRNTPHAPSMHVWQGGACLGQSSLSCVVQATLTQTTHSSQMHATAPIFGLNWLGWLDDSAWFGERGQDRTNYRVGRFGSGEPGLERSARFVLVSLVRQGQTDSGQYPLAR